MVSRVSSTPAERGTDNAMLAANYVTERGTDNAALANVTALEATLTAIKGAGWTTQTLVAIINAINNIQTGAIAGEVWAYATRVLTNLSDARAAYIDNLSGGAVALAANYTAARAAKIDNLDALISSRQATASAYYYSASLATGGTYVPAAGTIVQIAYISIDVGGEATWIVRDTVAAINLVDAYDQKWTAGYRTIFGPIYCDGTKIGFKNVTGGARTIYLYGFS